MGIERGRRERRRRNRLSGARTATPALATLAPFGAQPARGQGDCRHRTGLCPRRGHGDGRRRREPSRRDRKNQPELGGQRSAGRGRGGREGAARNRPRRLRGRGGRPHPQGACTRHLLSGDVVGLPCSGLCGLLLLSRFGRTRVTKVWEMLKECVWRLDLNLGLEAHLLTSDRERGRTAWPSLPPHALCA